MLLNTHLGTQAHDVARLNPNALAYVGDSVLELYWRLKFVWPPGRLVDQQRRVVDLVRAETQAKFLAWLLSASERNVSFVLRDREVSWVKRGRNAVSRRGPMRLKVSVYQDASGLECLVGYLYLTDHERCHELLDTMYNVSRSLLPPNR